MTNSVWLVMSVTSIVAATAEFLVSAMRMLPSGGTTVRNACGSTTSDIVWPKVRPSDRAASPWPADTELTPERSASQTNAAWYSAIASTAQVKNEKPWIGGPSLGR